MLFGHMSCFLTQLSIGLLIAFDSKVWLFLMTNIYCFVYNVSNGPIAYLYCNEISTDIAMAVVFTSLAVLLFF